MQHAVAEPAKDRIGDMNKFKHIKANPYHAIITIGLLSNGRVQVKMSAPQSISKQANLWEQMLNEAFGVIKNYREEEKGESSIITPETKIVAPN